MTENDKVISIPMWGLARRKSVLSNSFNAPLPSPIMSSAKVIHTTHRTEHGSQNCALRTVGLTESSAPVHHKHNVPCEENSLDDCFSCCVRSSRRSVLFWNEIANRRPTVPRVYQCSSSSHSAPIIGDCGSRGSRLEHTLEILSL